MKAARAHLMSWLGSAVLLALVLGLFVVPSPAIAHGGHDCGKVAARSSVVTAGVVEGFEAIAATAVENSSPVVAVVEGIEAEATAVTPVVRSDVQLSLEQLVPSEASVPGPIVCPCGAGCGSCFSASCCAGALVSPVLNWGVARAAGRSAVAALLQGAPGILGDPLPRPPNPVRQM